MFALSKVADLNQLVQKIKCTMPYPSVWIPWFGKQYEW